LGTFNEATPAASVTSYPGNLRPVRDRITAAFVTIPHLSRRSPGGGCSTEMKWLYRVTNRID
jgi:hypothetical protein